MSEWDWRKNKRGMLHHEVGGLDDRDLRNIFPARLKDMNQ